MELMNIMELIGKKRERESIYVVVIYIKYFFKLSNDTNVIMDSVIQL